MVESHIQIHLFVHSCKVQNTVGLFFQIVLTLQKQKCELGPFFLFVCYFSCSNFNLKLVKLSAEYKKIVFLELRYGPSSYTVFSVQQVATEHNFLPWIS